MNDERRREDQESTRGAHCNVSEREREREREIDTRSSVSPRLSAGSLSGQWGSGEEMVSMATAST